MAKDRTDVPANPDAREPSRASDIDGFLARINSLPQPRRGDAAHGRLIFAMDATMSRQPTWDSALHMQAEMFREAGRISGLEVQLVYFRGFRECRASRWVDNADELANLMTSVECRGGHTQIGKVLKHARKEASKAPVQAVVYVGDCMEENIDSLCQTAGELSLLGLPLFLFQEGRDTLAERSFRELARLSRGAYCRFDAGSARQLAELLSAVAVYAAGGRKALVEHASKASGARHLLEQLGD